MRKSFIATYDEALSEVDLLLMPACIAQAPKAQPAPDLMAALEADLGVFSLAEDRQEISEMSVGQLAVRNTMQFNYTGQPALSVPCAKVNGLPVAFWLIGRFFEDGLLLRAAAAFQGSVDWDAIIAVGPPS